MFPPGDVAVTDRAIIRPFATGLGEALKPVMTGTLFPTVLSGIGTDAYLPYVSETATVAVPAVAYVLGAVIVAVGVLPFVTAHPLDTVHV